MGKTGQRSRLSRRRKELIWTVGVVLYTVLRFVVAYGTLNQYGLNVWIFGFLDVATAVPYAIGTARLVESLVDRKVQAAMRWGALAAASFMAPYLYIAWGGRNQEMPMIVYVVLAILVLCLGANAALSVNKKVKAATHLHTLNLAQNPAEVSRTG